MIEKTLIRYLGENLNINIYFEVPKQGTSFVVLEKIGSSEENFIKTAKFAIQSYAESMLKAAELNEEVKRVMNGMVQLNDVSKVSLESDYNFTDTTMKKYRYQAVFEIVHF